MPTMPQKTKGLNELNSVNILNAVRSDIGGTYADQIPIALNIGDTIDGERVSKNTALMRLRDIGDIMTQNPPLQNAFLSALVNRIGRVIITSRLYNNPWSVFKKGLLEYGETVEEIFVNIAKPYQFSPEEAENEVFKRRIPDVKSAFHSMNYQKFYPTTVSEAQLRQAFLSFDGVTDLIGKIIDQMYTGANYDEFLVMKYMIAKRALSGGIYPVNVKAVTMENAREVTAEMVTQARNLTYMSNTYNEAGVQTYTDPSSLYTILTSKIESIFDVEVLALSFHMDKAELLGRQIGVDGFGTFDEDRLALIFSDDPYTTYTPFTSDEKAKLASIQALMVDENWFMIFDNFYNTTEIYNAQGLYWNYFYHVWKTFSVSPFSNAILFTTDTVAVTGVTVSPSAVSVAKGGSTQLTATVETTGFAPNGVHWEITAQGTASTVDQNGVVSVGADETQQTLTVKATSLYDPSQSGAATITVTG